MDAVKYLKEYDRMCKSYGITCKNCGIDKLRNEREGCSSIVYAHPEKVVAIVEKWSAAHPVKTRQSEFLKMFPNASLNELGSLTICPMDADKNQRCPEKSGAGCMDCRREFWLAEVE